MASKTSRSSWLGEIDRLAKRYTEAQGDHALDSKRADLRSSNANGATIARMISFGSCIGSMGVVLASASLGKLMLDDLCASILRLDIC